MARSDVVGDVRGAYLLMAVEVVDDKAAKRAFLVEKAAAAALCRIAFAKGLILYTRRTNGGRFGDWVMVAPPLIATEADIEEICALLETASTSSGQPWQDRPTATAVVGAAGSGADRRRRRVEPGAHRCVVGTVQPR